MKEDERTREEENGLHILETLYELASADLPANPSTVAEAVALELSELTQLLRRLDAQGLVDADRCRLTMSGLVLALSGARSTKLACRAA